MTDLSVLIPARNEEFLGYTVQNVLDNMQGDTEIIIVYDGNWPLTPIPDHKRIRSIYNHKARGQRAATNQAAKISTAKYIMKLDAHCAVDQGFDIKLMVDCQSDWTVVPRMFNLHAFDWKCQTCGEQTYQGPQPVNCEKCNGTEFEKVIVWQKKSGASDYMWFDDGLRFRYFDGICLKPYGHDIKALKKKYHHKYRDWAQGDITDQMTALGACWFMQRDRFWELEGLDEQHGSWGQMGVEIACKSWLSGGRQVVNKKTWFAHMFRTKQGFGFPYPNPAKAVKKARKRSKKLWTNDGWSKAKYPLDWMLSKFAPLPGWEVKPILRLSEPTKGIIYYTDNLLDEIIAEKCRAQLSKIGLPIVSASLKPLDFGTNITLDLERGILTMFRQILAALQVITTDVVYFCEHDILYHPSHFTFTPPTTDTFYYNENTWKVNAQTGDALFYFTQQTSGLCCYRNLAINHYMRRVARIEQEQKYDRRIGFEPGCHQYPRGIDDRIAKSWMSECPNIDIRHQANLTPSRWTKDQFRNQKYCQGWTEAGDIPGWGITQGRFQEFLSEIQI